MAACAHATGNRGMHNLAIEFGLFVAAETKSRYVLGEFHAPFLGRMDPAAYGLMACLASHSERRVHTLPGLVELVVTTKTGAFIGKDCPEV